MSALPTAIEELRARRQWVVWRYEIRHGKETKVPYCPLTGQMAKSNDPETWVGYLAAVSAEGYDGIGFVVTADDPYVGIDIDSCIASTGEIAGWALEILGELRSYTEITPSGVGLRVWIKGKLPPGRRRHGIGDETGGDHGPAVELYDSGRYFTFTGRALPDLPASIEERQEELCRLHASISPLVDERPRSTPSPRPTGTAALADEVILAAAERAKNGAEIMRLYRGDWKGGRYPSQSEADEALCYHLAFYTKDALQLDRLFCASGLYRPKWEGKHYASGRTYGEETVAKALSGVTEQYQPQALVPPPLTDEEAPPAGRERAPGQPSSEGALEDPESADEIAALYDRLIAPHLYTAAALQHEIIPPIVWIVPDLLPEGLTMISGNAKLGKTFLATGIAGPVAYGGKVFGKIEVAQGRVLYVALEDRKRRTKSRLQHLFTDEEGWPASMELIHLWPRMNQGGAALLREHLRRHPDTRLIVLDTWNAVRAPHSRGGDIVMEDYVPFEDLARLAEEYHVAVLVIHHDSVQKKGDWVNAAAGSSGLAAAANAVWHFERLRGEHEAQLDVTGHDVKEGKLQFKRDERTGFWSLLGDADQIMKSRERQEVFALLKVTGPLSPKQIAMELDKHHGTIGNLCTRMVQDGELQRIEGGKYAPLRIPGSSEHLFHERK